MSQCWKKTKEERPSFTQLKLQLKASRLALRRDKNVPVSEGNASEEGLYMDMNSQPRN